LDKKGRNQEKGNLKDPWGRNGRETIGERRLQGEGNRPKGVKPGKGEGNAPQSEGKRRESKTASCGGCEINPR